MRHQKALEAARQSSTSWAAIAVARREQVSQPGRRPCSILYQGQRSRSRGARRAQRHPRPRRSSGSAPPAARRKGLERRRPGARTRRLQPPRGRSERAPRAPEGHASTPFRGPRRAAHAAPACAPAGPPAAPLERRPKARSAPWPIYCGAPRPPQKALQQRRGRYKRAPSVWVTHRWRGTGRSVAGGAVTPALGVARSFKGYALCTTLQKRSGSRVFWLFKEFSRSTLGGGP